MAPIPYNICNEAHLEKEVRQARILEGVYHKAQDKIWNGNEVLNELLKTHGPILISEESSNAIKNIFSIILWGELVAWKVSLQLGANIDDFSAKMAATSQAHDEARHFYVMKDYLDLLGHNPKPLSPKVAKVLEEVLHTKNLAKKLLGMQLMVEPIALTIFRFTRKLNVEPILTDLLAFYEIDESRHIALGIQYLPKLIKKMNKFQLASLIIWQAKVINAEIRGLKEIESDVVALGLDPLEIFEYAEKKQMECLELIAKQMGISLPFLGPLRRIIEFRKALAFYPNKKDGLLVRVKNSLIAAF